MTQTLQAAVDRWILSIVIPAVLAILIFTHHRDDFSAWTATHWLFTYEHGFIKRGLVGTLTAYVAASVTASDLMVLYTVLAVCAATTLAIWVWVTLLQTVGRSTATGPGQRRVFLIALACFLLTSPGTIPQWFEDPGRFDALGFLLLSLSIVLTMVTPRAVGLTAATAVSACAILVHEGFFFWVPAMCLGVWLWRHGGGTQNILLVSCCALSLVGLTALTGTSSYSDVVDFETAKSALARRADFPMSNASLMVQYRSFADNLAYTAERAWEPRRLTGLALGVMYLGGFAGFVLAQVRRMPDGTNRSFGALLLCCFAPLGLLLLGHDQGRWFAMVQTNLVLVWLMALRTPRCSREQFNWPRTGLLVIGTVVNLGLGPFGVTALFPHLEVLDVG